jgi:hypothetical protein
VFPQGGQSVSEGISLFPPLAPSVSAFRQKGRESVNAWKKNIEKKTKRYEIPEQFDFLSRLNMCDGFSGQREVINSGSTFLSTEPMISWQPLSGEHLSTSRIPSEGEAVLM